MPSRILEMTLFAKDKASAIFKSFGKAAKFVLKGIAIGAAVMGAAVVAGMTKAIKSFAEFEQQLAEVGTLADFTTDQMADMTSQTLDFSIAFNQATDALNKARYDVVSAGFASMAEQTILMTQAAKGAVAGVSDVATTVDLLTTVLNAYQLPAIEAERVSDLLFTTVKVGKTTINEMAASWGNLLPAANAAGVALTDVGAAFGVLTAAGIRSEQAVTGLRTVFTKLAAATPESQRAMDELGISVKNSAGQLLSMERIIEQFQGLDVETISKILPSEEAARAMLSLTANFEKYKQTVESFDPEAMAGATDAAFEKMTNTISFQLGQLKKRWDAFFVNIMTGEAGEALKQALKDLNQWFEDNKAMVEGWAMRIGELFANLVDFIVPIVSKIAGAASNLRGILAEFMLILAKIALKVGEFISKLNPTLLARMLGVTREQIHSLASGVFDLGNMAVDTANELFELQRQAILARGAAEEHAASVRNERDSLEDLADTTIKAEQAIFGLSNVTTTSVNEMAGVLDESLPMISDSGFNLGVGLTTGMQTGIAETAPFVISEAQSIANEVQAIADEASQSFAQVTGTETREFQSPADAARASRIQAASFSGGTFNVAGAMLAAAQNPQGATYNFNGPMMGNDAEAREFARQITKVQDEENAR